MSIIIRPSPIADLDTIRHINSLGFGQDAEVGERLRLLATAGDGGWVD